MAAVMTVLALGISVDLSRVIIARERTQQIVDAAVRSYLAVPGAMQKNPFWYQLDIADEVTAAMQPFGVAIVGFNHRSGTPTRLRIVVLLQVSLIFARVVGFANLRTAVISEGLVNPAIRGVMPRIIS